MINYNISSLLSFQIIFGSRGTKDKEFLQPCGVAVDSSDNLLVIDTGNLRLKKLTSNLNFVGHIYNEGLEGRSVTGICIPPGQDNIFFVNWYKKKACDSFTLLTTFVFIFQANKNYHRNFSERPNNFYNNQ